MNREANSRFGPCKEENCFPEQARIFPILKAGRRREIPRPNQKYILLLTARPVQGSQPWQSQIELHNQRAATCFSNKTSQIRVSLWRHRGWRRSETSPVPIPLDQAGSSAEGCRRGSPSQVGHRSKAVLDAVPRGSSRREAH